MKKVFGLEIEVEVLDPKFTQRIGSYSYPKVCEESGNWYAGMDASLSPVAGGQMVEFNSRPFTLDETDKILNDFQGIFGYQKLNKYLRFNRTCGHHIHVSGWQDVEILNLKDAPYEVIKNIPARDGALYDGDIWWMRGKKQDLKIDQYSLFDIRKILKSLPKLAQKNYFRGYARETQSHDIGRRNSSMELNTLSESHIEYRSFNLMGVRTWKRFGSLYKKMLSLLNDAV